MSGVVLDIGGDVGAVVVLLGARPGVEELDELDIQPVGDPARRFHTGVHVRDGMWTAVYPAVRAGRYELLNGDGVPFAELDAVGGEVVTLDLR